jgi:hypothetical protein
MVSKLERVYCCRSTQEGGGGGVIDSLEEVRERE